MMQISDETGTRLLIESVTKKISIKVALALALVAILSVSAYYMLTVLIEAQTSAGAIVNASGRRRYLSQRIVMFSNMMITSQTQVERDNAREGLKASIAMFIKNHKGLLNGDAELKLPGNPSPEVADFYFKAPALLDERLEKYIETARRLVAAPDSEISVNNADIKYINENGPTNIIQDLDKAVGLYQKEIERDVKNIQSTQALILIVTLSLIILEGLFIFRPMVKKIKNEMLEVHRKADEINARTKTIETIYSKVKSGFLLINENLEIQDGFTQSCHTLFGKSVKAGASLGDYLQLSERDFDMYKLLLAQVFQDILPEDMSLVQLPDVFQIGSKTIRLEGSAIRKENGNVENVMFTVTDITSQKVAEEQSKFYSSMLGILQQKDSFRSFVIDCKEKIAECRKAIQEGSDAQTRFFLHTLKGNSASFGMQKIVELIHAVESEKNISEYEINLVEEAYREFLSVNFSLLNVSFDEELQRTYVIEAKELDKLNVHIASISEVQKMRDTIFSWIYNVKKIPSQSAFLTIVESARSLAARLEKNVDVILTTPEVRIDAEYLKPVIENLVHLVRNAVDHGIELPSERGEKVELARIEISVKELDANWEITVADDGKGINIDKVVEKAISSNLITEADALSLSVEEKQKLIFKSGVSTAEKLTMISGRGVGMSAVEEAVKTLGGTIVVQSKLGLGSKFVLSVPKQRSAFTSKVCA